MTTASTHTQALQYFAGKAEVRASAVDGTVPVVELAMPYGAMPPLHVHDEDETVVVVEGRVTFFVGDEVVEASSGDSLVAPRGIPHSFRVESEDGARWITITPRGCYERFVRKVSMPVGAGASGPGPMTLKEAVAFTAAAAQHGIEILGPPGTLPTDL
jgi:quercetin dioxygenase-like cupin family protein